MYELCAYTAFTQGRDGSLYINEYVRKRDSDDPNAEKPWSWWESATAITYNPWTAGPWRAKPNDPLWKVVDRNLATEMQPISGNLSAVIDDIVKQLDKEKQEADDRVRQGIADMTLDDFIGPAESFTMTEEARASTDLTSTVKLTPRQLSEAPTARMLALLHREVIR